MIEERKKENENTNNQYNHRILYVHVYQLCKDMSFIHCTHGNTHTHTHTHTHNGDNISSGLWKAIVTNHSGYSEVEFYCCCREISNQREVKDNLGVTQEKLDQKILVKCFVNFLAGKSSSDYSVW